MPPGHTVKCKYLKVKTFVHVLSVRFTFGWSQHVGVTEAAYKHNSSERVEGRGPGAQVLHRDIPHLQKTKQNIVADAKHTLDNITGLKADKQITLFVLPFFMN